MIEKELVRNLIEELEESNREVDFDLSGSSKYLTVYEQIVRVQTYHLNLRLIERLKKLIE